MGITAILCMGPMGFPWEWEPNIDGTWNQITVPLRLYSVA